MRDNPFEQLGIEPQFDLDAPQVEAAYLRRAAALHPDRFTDPIEQSDAAQRAAALNTARDVLLNPERRANALLRLLGGPPSEVDKSLPDGFLMEMMDVRQDMEQALASDVPDERQRVEHWAATQREDYLKRVGALFEQVADESAASSHMSGPLLADVRLQLNALRYIERMIEQLDPLHEPSP